MLRRGGSTEICHPATQISVVRLFSHYNLGGFHRKKKSIHTISAKDLSYPHTEFGERRSRRLAINFFKIRKCHLLVTLAFLDISSKKR